MKKETYRRLRRSAHFNAGFGGAMAGMAGHELLYGAMSHTMLWVAVAIGCAWTMSGLGMLALSSRQRHG